MTVRAILADIALLRRAAFTEGTGEDSSTSTGFPCSTLREESAGGSDNDGKLILGTSQ